MINAPELNLPHYNILIAQEDWLYQILNCIIGRSSLRLFIIGLILNLKFHWEWLKLTRLNQIDFKIFYLLAQGKKGIIIRGVTIRVSCIERFTGSSKWKWSSLSPWSGDFGVNRARVCRYLVVWNALGEGSDLISSLSSAGMFPWQRSTVCVSRFAV